MRFRLPAALAAIPLALALLAFAAPAVSAADGHYSKEGEHRLYVLIQREHQRVCGTYIPVRQPYQLVKLARWRSYDMLERSYFSHTIKGTDNKVFDYLAKYGDRDWTAAGEIIAYNAYYGETEYDAATRAYRQFMGSSTHRSVIRDCRYNAIGVGNYVRDGRHYFTVVFARQPRVRVSVSRTGIYKYPHGGISTRLDVAEYGERLYIFRHGRDGSGSRWDFGIIRGHPWGWVKASKTS